MSLVNKVDEEDPPPAIRTKKKRKENENHCWNEIINNEFRVAACLQDVNTVSQWYKKVKLESLFRNIYYTEKQIL